MRNSLLLDNAKARQLSKVSVLWAEILFKTPINRIKAALPQYMYSSYSTETLQKQNLKE